MQQQQLKKRALQFEYIELWPTGKYLEKSWKKLLTNDKAGVNINKLSRERQQHIEKDVKNKIKKLLTTT